MNVAPVAHRNRIQIREAVAADNPALLALTRATPMDGGISIRIDRDPDFFALLRLRGTGKVFVALRGNEVVGCISAAMHTGYVSGLAETVAYVGDLKVDPRFRGTATGLRLIQALQAFLESIGVDLCFSVVADGNRRVMPFFEGRMGTPRWVQLGRFLVDELLPSPFQGSTGAYSIRAATPEDVPVITTLLDRFHRARQFAPRLCEGEMAGVVEAGLVLVARFGGAVVATLSLRDLGEVKRNVLLGAPGYVRAGLALLRVATAPLGGFSTPRIGDSLRLLSVRHLACDDEHRAAARALLAWARAEAYRRRFLFLVVGLHERDPLRTMLRGIPRFTFTSLALVTSLENPGRLETLKSGIPFEDFALV